MYTSIPNPILYPEVLRVTPTSIYPIKALIVPHIDASPQIVTDTPDNMLSTFFPNDTSFAIRLDEYLTVYVNIMQQALYNMQNYVATFYARYKYSIKYGIPPTYTICGAALFVSSKPVINSVNLNLPFYSVPYECVQEILEIYDNYEASQKIPSPQF